MNGKNLTTRDRARSERAATLTAAAAVALLVAGQLAAGDAMASTHLPRAGAAEHQVDAAALASAIEAARQLGYVYGIVVARDGAVLGEGHWTGTAATLHDSRSVTKSVTSMLLGIAIDRGLIKEGFSARVCDYLPEALRPDDPAKRDIRLFHLLTHTSGLQWNEETDFDAWERSPDPAAFILERPLVAPPGTTWSYSSAATHLLSLVIAEASGMSTLEFADSALFSPLGITDRHWQVIGGHHNGAAGLSLTTEDLAKLGLTMVAHGEIGGYQVLSRYWTNVSTYQSVLHIGRFGPFSDRNYGLLWWNGRWGDSEAPFAWGYGGQFIFCVPGLRLVVATHARRGIPRSLAAQQAAAILSLIVDRIVPAVTDRRVFTVTGTPAAELAGIDEMMRDKMQAHDITRATAAVAKDGRLVLAHGYTWDEPEVAPTAPTAVFRIGSVSKAITSVATHQLIERGLLAYDTRVAETLGLEQPPGGRADPWLADVTVDNLLTHTVGWDKDDGGVDPMGLRDWLIADALGTEQPPTRGEIATFMAGQPMQFEPGSRWAYCNFGYLLLELLAEHVTGVSFPEWVQEHVFRPIGVGRVRLGHTLESELFPGEPVYDGVIEGNPTKFTAENVFAAGTQVMASPDLVRLLSSLFDAPDASGLLLPDTIADMLAYPFPAGEEIGYGRGWIHEKMFALLGHTMGWFTDPTDGYEVLGHSGQGPGQQAIALWRSDGITFAFMTNKDSMIQNFDDFPTITAWPQHDLWGSVGITDQPAGSASTETWIPIAAHNDGVGTSVWRTDVGLLNRSPLPNTVRLLAYAADGIRDIELSLDAGEARAIDDVLAEIGASGTAPLRVLSSEQLTVTSRTYNDDPIGTFGQAIGGECGSCGLGTGDTVVLMQMREDREGRSNIGLLNGWKRPARVRITLLDGSGAEVVSFEKTVPPEQTLQVNRPFRVEGGRSDVASGYALVNVLFGRQVAAYGSVVDAGTNDPTTVPMRRLRGSTSQWIAAAAHGTGLNGSVWRTDLALLNPASSPANAQIVLHRNGDPASATVAVAPGEQLSLADVVAALGASGSGALEITSDVPILATARTYNEGASGTFGQFFGGEEAPSTAAPSGPLWLPSLRQNIDFRTNIGLLNTCTAPISVRLRLFDSHGGELAVADQILPPRVPVQLLAPYGHLAGRDDIASGYVRVEVTSGGQVIAYASVVDNHTNDPTTVLALH